jgi:hypothetical protein
MTLPQNAVLPWSILSTNPLSGILAFPLPLCAGPPKRVLKNHEFLIREHDFPVFISPALGSDFHDEKKSFMAPFSENGS